MGRTTREIPAHANGLKKALSIYGAYMHIAQFGEAVFSRAIGGSMPTSKESLALTASRYALHQPPKSIHKMPRSTPSKLHSSKDETILSPIILFLSLTMTKCWP